MKPLLAVAVLMLVLAGALLLWPMPGRGWGSNALHPFGDLGAGGEDYGWFAYTPLTRAEPNPVVIAHRRRWEAAALTFGGIALAGVAVTRRRRPAA